jgi:heterodisulfide reductase subunit A
MARLVIDGQEFHAEEGQTVLEVARKNGVAIPTLCYHPVLEPYGGCRLCLVEVIRRGGSQLVTSCTYPAGDGIEVKTRSAPVLAARKAVLGLLLSRCPNVPLVQNLAREYGVLEPPFPTDNPDETCILCGQCVRVCHEMVKANVLNYADHGPERKIGPAFMEKTRQCIGCGACTIVCPTRAIEIILEEEAVYEAKPLGPTSSIYVPSLQAVPRVPVIDTDTCIRFRQQDRSAGQIEDACGACQILCEAGAIDFTQQDEILDLDVGAIVVATGFQLWDPHQLPQYSYGKSPNIITGLEFERLSNAGGATGGQILLANGKRPEKVAIFHCVGSRDTNAHEYCSRFCCMYALKHAHQVHDKTGAEVFEFYMDMRTFGKGYEEFYQRVQEEGIVMVRGRGAEVEVLPDGKLRVKGEDANLGRVVTVEVDMVILNTAIEPVHDASKISALFGLGRTPDGFFAERHPKLAPVQTNTEGVFLAGNCQGPRDVPDTVAHAGAAAVEALRLLVRGEVIISPIVAQVNPDKCVGCGDCLLVCPYTAITRVEGKAQVNPALCQGCGTCAATCPSQAITALHFTDEELVAQVDGLLALLA